MQCTHGDESLLDVSRERLCFLPSLTEPPATRQENTHPGNTIQRRSRQKVLDPYGTENTPCSGELPSHKVRKLAVEESFGQR